MSRDLITDRYGRFYEIPYFLSGMGHTLELVSHSYRNVEEAVVTEGPGLILQSYNLGLNPLTGFWRHYHRLDKFISSSRPDLIIAASDCYQIILGAALAARHTLPFIADLYDNFAYYKASRVPGALTLFARALRRADVITVVSNALMQLVMDRYAPAGRVCVVENAVPENFLLKQDREKARQCFGFEKDRLYIGTAGELSREKGVHVLIKAFLGITQTNRRTTLVLAGRKEDQLDIPDRDDIKYLGMLDQDKITDLFTALDAGVICIKDNDFGRYCFPQKFYEMAACGLPVVASAVGEMQVLLKDLPGSLFRPDDSADLQRALQQQLAGGRREPRDVPTWKMQAGKFDRFIRDIVNK
jgi:glycosyltransferase involved in cell wall biosynthesis